MYNLSRWWGKRGIQLLFITLALGGGWFLKETKGEAIMELYQSVYRTLIPQGSSKQKIENAQITELENRLVTLQTENQKLKQLLGYIESEKRKGIAAPIIGRSADHWWEQVTIGRGSKDGIKEGFIVMTTGGLIGRIIHVTPNTSRVLLVTDPSSRVGVIIGRSRFMGYIRGQGNNRAVMQFFEKVPDVKKGDLVSTSAISELFPSGLPVGKVESVQLNRTSAPEATIELSAPINLLEWVIVYPKWENPADKNTDNNGEKKTDN
jgi:rod shape-determining protein MreC